MQKLLCVSPTRFYHDSFSFKENTYPVLNQRHISVDIRTAPFFTGANHARSRFSKPTLPQRAACWYCRKSHSCYRDQGVFQVSQGSRGFCLIPRSTIINRLTMDMQTALRTLSQDLPYRLCPEHTTVLEQLDQGRHVFVSLPTGLWEKWMFNCFSKAYGPVTAVWI